MTDEHIERIKQWALQVDYLMVKSEEILWLIDRVTELTTPPSTDD